MKILLVRHGKKAQDLPGVEDKQLPLSDLGRTQVQELTSEFLKVDLRPTLFLSSHYLHALETARLVAKELGDHPAPTSVPLNTLTPHNPYTFELIVKEAAGLGFPLENVGAVCMVLHHPRVHQLTAAVTSTPLQAEDPGYATATCICGNSLTEMLQGKGHLRHVWRRPEGQALMRRDYDRADSETA